MSRSAISELKPRRRTQQERRDETQKRLLEATLDCLIKLGYARTTTTEIVSAAGVSQGALFKHYPSKAALMSACVEHLFRELVEGYSADFAALPRDAATPEAAFELLWSIFSGPRCTVAFELYMAARTDPELARALEPVVRRHRVVLAAEARRLFPHAAQRIASFDALVDLLMCAMEGMVIERYGAGDQVGPAREVLKQLTLFALSRDSAATHGKGGAPWMP